MSAPNPDGLPEEPEAMSQPDEAAPAEAAPVVEDRAAGSATLPGMAGSDLDVKAGDGPVPAVE